MTDTSTTLDLRGTEPLRHRPFVARPVCAAGRETRSQQGPYATHYTATASWLYINRLAGSDRFGAVPDTYSDRGDLVAAGRCHPQKQMPADLRTGDLLWREADEAAAREGPRAVSAIHIVADLPPDAEPMRWQWLVESYAYRHLVSLGMVVDYGVHARQPGATTGPSRPHVHLLASAVFWRRNGRQGGRQWQWLATAEQTRAAEQAWLRHVGLQTNAAA